MSRRFQHLRFLLVTLGLLAVAVALAEGVQAQETTGTVAGRVVDAQTQQPLNVAQVFIPGLSVGVLSGSNGTYQLQNVPAGPHTMNAELLGYAPQTAEVTVVAGETVVVDFELVAQALALDELVVVGYAQQTRASLSGSVSSIENTDIVRTSATTTAEMLSGKIPGINTRLITNGNNYSNNPVGVSPARAPRDGRPGGTTELQIRNMGAPLFVIDGVPSSDYEFNQMAATDIESISVLKDASASVYGFRAANGVVLVTTKRGQASRSPRVEVSAYYGWQNIPRSRYPSGYGDNAYQLKYSYVESEQNRGQARSISAEELEGWRTGTIDGYLDREMWKFFIQDNAPMSNVNASVAGGTDNSNYYLSLSHVSQDYVMPDNNFSRLNVQANLSTELFEGFRVGTELRTRQENHETVAITDAGADALLHYFRAISSAWPFEDPYANSNPNYINGDVHYFIRSPVAFTRGNSGEQNQIRTNIAGNLWAEYQLPFGTTLRATYNRTKDLEEYDVHRYTFDGFKYNPADDTYSVLQSYGGQTRLSTRAVGDRDFWNVTANQSLEFGSHTISALAGIEFSKGEATEENLQSVPPTNFNPLISYVDVVNANTSWDIERRASYLGRLNYDYEGKYLIEAVGRYDGSFLYAPGKRWGFFPGVSLGWRISEESFFQDAVPWVNELKLRASWGQAGREEGVNNWDYLGGATYGQGLPAVLNGQVVTGIQPRGLPVTNISWVTSTSRNIGVDFAVWDAKIAGQFDAFERKLTGLPQGRYDVALPSELGYSLPDENLESEATLGFEALVRYSDRIGDVAFSVAPNFTIARRKILDRYKPRYGSSYDRWLNAEEDRWADPFFTIHQTGVFQSMEEIARYPIDIDGQGNRTLLPGDLIYEDTNHDGLIDNLDERVRGFEDGQTPILSYGMNGTISYAGFTLSYDLAGGAMYNFNPSNLVTVPHQTEYNGFTSLSNRWRRADPYDDNSEWIPGEYPPLRRAQTSHSSYRTSDFKRIRVRYLRLKRLELGYTIPGALAERLGSANMRIYTSIANPMLLDNTRLFAVDPEIANTSAFQHPYAVVFNVGFSASMGGR